MQLRAFRVSVVAVVLALGAITVTAVAATSLALAFRPATATAAVEPPPVTANPFIPEDRSISECVSALPKPGCGSEERGGWHQYLVFISLVGGLSIIGWRIVAGVRKGRPVPPPAEREVSAGSTRG